MRRILLMAGAITCGLLAMGLTACDPEDLADVALPTVKAAAIKVAIGAAEGDTKAREILLSAASGWCQVPEADRLALRQAFTLRDRPAFAVDCVAVAGLIGGNTSMRSPAGQDPPVPVARPRAIAALTPIPNRRE